MKHTYRMKAGNPYPRGATWDGSGVNFAVFSANATKVEICLFDETGKQELERYQLPEYTDEVFHGYLDHLRPGQLYGLRVHGPYDPENGHRFNPNKLLIDPYAHALHGELQWNDAVFGYTPGHKDGDLSFDERDSAPYVPKSIVVDSAFTWHDEARPHTPWNDTIIYEAHVKGMTQRNTRLAPELRGTIAGIGQGETVEYLSKLGISAIELLPIHAFIDDHFLTEKGFRNYWGYNTIGFFAIEPRYLASGHISEFRTMVKNLHKAGIEVILDVVYNHTAEGNEMGPTLCFRGIDNASYYRLSPEDNRFYYDTTGCGNSLNLHHPRVLQLVMDSLRYWVTEMHVDGFRFDLASTLARVADADFDTYSSFFDAIRQDPTLSTVKLIAEPWDMGKNGYQVGGFPPGWSEWNDKFRDTARQFWKGDEGKLADFASRLAGSSDVYNHQGRKPHASINFITAHDGFCLKDLVSYNAPHNEANKEKSGSENNQSWNCGEEGPSENKDVLDLRYRQKRNFLSTLLLSQGVPMLLGGDEIGRTQQGNNNAYCQDSEISWYDWNLSERNKELLRFTRMVIALRKKHPALRRNHFFTGQLIGQGGQKDMTWIAPNGKEMQEQDWNMNFAHAMGYYFTDETGHDGPFLILINSYHEALDFLLPDAEYSTPWKRLFDTTLQPREYTKRFEEGETYRLEGRSFVLLKKDIPK